MSYAILEGAKKLRQRLSKLDEKKRPGSQYFQRCVGLMIEDFDAILPRYINILEKTLETKTIETSSILDFGGGVGMLSLLAYFSGFQRIHYADISDEMCYGAEALFKQLDAKITSFHTCSYEDLSNVKIEPVDYILSYDVIDHIYSPEKAFVNLKSLLKPDGEIIMTSNANTYNPVLRYFYNRKNKIAEEIGLENERKMDSKKAYFEKRKDIIQTKFPDLSAYDVYRLSKLTSGFRKNDIVDKVQFFIETNILPEPHDNYNACDPQTGNWDNNLIPYFKLAKHLKKRFAEVNVESELYPTVEKKKFYTSNNKDRNILHIHYSFLSFFAQIFASSLNKIMLKLPYYMKFIFAPSYSIRTKNGSIAKEVASIYDNWSAWREENVQEYDLKSAYVPNISTAKVLHFLKLNELDKNAKIADIGCGNGAAVLNLKAKNYWNIYASDIAEKASFLDNFTKSEMDSLPYKNGEMDFAYALSVLHYSENLKKTLQEIHRILKPNAYFIATFHTRFSLFNLEMKAKKMKNPEKYKHYQFLTMYDRKTLKRCFEETGFEWLESNGIHPFYCFTKLIYLNEKIRDYISLPNVFFWIEKKLQQHLSPKIASDIAYHSIVLVRKRK